MKRRKISVRLYQKLVDEIDSMGSNRSRVVEEALLREIIKMRKKKVSDTLL